VRLLARSYPSLTDAPPAAVARAGGRSGALSREEMWTAVLRQAVSGQWLDHLIGAILEERWEKRLADELTDLLENVGDSRKGLQKFTADNAGPIETEAFLRIGEVLRSRTAIVLVNEKFCGSGCLITDRFLLTCQHVVEQVDGKLADPATIEVVFDFDRRSGTTYIETGLRVRVTQIVSHSPPADAERPKTPSHSSGADREHLDYAILELESLAPAVQVNGEPTSRGYYRLYSNTYWFRSDELLLLAHYPRANYQSISHLSGQPEYDHEGTRLFYRCNTEQGSSGGPIVNMQGRLTGLHQGFPEAEDRNRGIPVSVIANNIKDEGLDYLVEASEPGQIVQIGRYRYSRSARERVCQALADDPSVVIRYLQVPVSIDDPDKLWDWLEHHGKLRKLRIALEKSGRDDLTRILDTDRIVVDRATDSVGPRSRAPRQLYLCYERGPTAARGHSIATEPAPGLFRR
jgi:Trypsin-like peptidase domain/Bacterial Death-like domain 3